MIYRGMNRLTRYLLFGLFAFGFGLKGMAQHGGGGYNMPFRNNGPYRNNRPYRNNQQQGFRENRPGINKLNAIRNAYINKQLNLSPDEADRFWPLYDQYQSELNQIYRQRRLNNASPQQNTVEQLNRDMFYEQRILTTKQHYKDQFLRVLPPEKVNTLYQSERDFRGELIQQLHERTNPIK